MIQQISFFFKEKGFQFKYGRPDFFLQIQAFKKQAMSNVWVIQIWNPNAISLI